MSQISVAILGQGRSGYSIHGQSLSKMTDKYKIVAVMDDLAERRRRAEQEYHCSSYDDYRDLFQRKDIDLIVNALPSYLHVPVTLEFLNAGYHVLSEKPVARFASEVDSLIEASKKSGRTLAIYQQSRFSPAFVQMRKIIASGVLGRIVQVSISFSGFARRWDWQTLKSMNGGSLLNTGPHPVDQALQLFGTDQMPAVFCRMDSVNSYGDAEDYVKLVLYGEGRPTIDVEISSCSAYPLFTYQVQGEHGGLTGNTSHLEWKYFDPSQSQEHQLTTTPLQNDDGSPAYCSEDLVWKQEEWNVSDALSSDPFSSMSEVFYNMLYDTLTKGVPLQVTPQEVRQQIAVMEECYRQNPRFSM